MDGMRGSDTAQGGGGGSPHPEEQLPQVRFSEKMLRLSCMSPEQQVTTASAHEEGVSVTLTMMWAALGDTGALRGTSADPSHPRLGQHDLPTLQRHREQFPGWVQGPFSRFLTGSFLKLEVFPVSATLPATCGGPGGVPVLLNSESLHTHAHTRTLLSVGLLSHTHLHTHM